MVKPHKIASKVDASTLPSTLYVKFGRYILQYPRLQKGELVVRSPAVKPIRTRAATVKVSPRFVSVMTDHLDIGEINYPLARLLADHEKELFFSLCIDAGVRCDPLKLKDDHEQLKTRFTVLKGSIIAGNTNPKIIAEMREVVQELYDNEVIGPDDYSSLMEFLEE